MITLSSGAIAFTVTFLDKVTSHDSAKVLAPPTSLYFSWALFALAIFFALWTLSAITGTLLVLDRAANGWEIVKQHDKDVVEGKDSNLTLPPILNYYGSFFLAVLAMIGTGAQLQPH